MQGHERTKAELAKAQDQVQELSQEKPSLEHKEAVENYNMLKKTYDELE